MARDDLAKLRWVRRGHPPPPVRSLSGNLLREVPQPPPAVRQRAPHGGARTFASGGAATAGDLPGRATACDPRTTSEAWILQGGLPTFFQHP